MEPVEKDETLLAFGAVVLIFGAVALLGYLTVCGMLGWLMFLRDMLR
jgi:hypothetical protein